jgi:hypothetical protein
MWLLY